MAIHDIVEHVRGATAWVTDGPAPQGNPKGTAFLVAPGIAVTCSHVLRDAGAAPHLWWRGQSLPADVLAASADDPNDPTGWPFPDAAVVQVALTDHPVVPVADATVGAPVWCYGITRARLGQGGRPEADGRHLQVALTNPAGFLQLTGGAILPGMSGGPVVDLDRFAVVGLTQSSASTQTDAGGWATPIGAALDLHPGLRAIVEGLDRESLAALRRDQAALGDLPLRVTARVKDVAEALRLHLEQLTGTPAPQVPAADLPEWVARQLFGLTLADFVGALMNVLGTLGPAALDVFELVAPCVRTRPAADSHLVPTDCADDVRAELETAAPRIVHVNTDEVVCTRLLLQRALAQTVTLKPVGGASAATSVGGVPTGLREELEAYLMEELAVTPAEWAESPQDYAQTLRNRVFTVDPGAAPDSTAITGLAAAFPGLRIVVPRRTFTAPDGVDAALHSLAPPLDAKNEKFALLNLKTFNDALASRNLPPVT
jgi:S1-C subfamily serine protease